MKISKLAVCGLIMAAMLGCGGKSASDDLARKDVRAPKAPPPPPRVVAEAIDPNLRASAIAEINTDYQSPDAILRANSIEALQDTIGLEARGKIVQALEDKSPVVRFAAAMAAGTLKIPEAQAPVLELVPDANPSVRVAARFALHQLGDTRLSHDLEKFSQDPNIGVRANTALVLGKIGAKSASVVLQPMLNDSAPAVRVQAAEALWKLGSQNGLENLVTATISQAPDDQIVALIALAEPKDNRVAGVIYGKLVADYPEVSLAAARAMGMLGSDAGYAVAMRSTQSSAARERALAAWALGAIGRSDAQTALGRLLKDADVNVRFAAATAILQLKAPRPG